YDAETGLHYNRHRYYDPKTGRYLTPDPIGLAGGINPYVYVGGDPVNRMDPLGLTDLNLLPPESDEFTYANAATSPPNTFTVAAHGNTRWFFDQQLRRLSPRQLANLIRNHPNYSQGMTVRLDSCNTGVNPGKGQPSPGQKLADELGTNVLAPDNFVWFGPSGKPVVAPAQRYNPDQVDMSDPGRYILYAPRREGSR
ncbi:MAG TPA: RHS repeat-associated core domain-containing protein, partial [Syntrophobacter fumaroxidans]|nr:RHS repeat-associated core domain-containing protein [Syntrophobacter fumaroxidans]